MGLTALYWEDPGRRMVPLADHIGGGPVHWDPSSGMVGPELAGPGLRLVRVRELLAL